MKKISFLCFSLVLGCLFFSCSKSNKSIIRMQHIEEGVSNPQSIEEYQDAIKKYEERVADIQLAQSQIGIWYKILGTRYIEKKMYGEALKCFQSALEYYPDNQNLYYYVGLCAAYMSHAALDYDATGSAEKKANYLKLSEEAYLRAISIEPRYTRALYAISCLYDFELGKPESEIQNLKNFWQTKQKIWMQWFCLQGVTLKLTDLTKQFRCMTGLSKLQIQKKSANLQNNSKNR